MPSVTTRQRTLDARPDRIDLRDRIYQPRLVDLPPVYPTAVQLKREFTQYVDAGLILDQGKEGACTGFGLAAMINFTLWRRARDEGPSRGKVRSFKRVSPAMLYHLAQIYDEWTGEDYEGSSCRGAMKGWHRHGVCDDRIWPYHGKKFTPPAKAWHEDAAQRPLGAYYRVDKDAITDLQSAIFEVGAIYVSAEVHDGWFLDQARSLPVIPLGGGPAVGGHAFALVGWTSQGFIVQNSWGPKWGYHGFAVLTYDDWATHGTDAWVGMPGVPLAIRSPSAVSTLNLNQIAAGRSAWFFSHGKKKATPLGLPPWEAQQVAQHSLIFDNDGRPRHHLVDTEDGEGSLEAVTLHGVRAWMKQNPANRKLVVYAHGGLNSEDAGLKRSAIMGPYIEANGIHPLFIVWRTGFGESLGGIIQDALARWFGGQPAESAFGKVLQSVSESVAAAKNRTIEVACERLGVKAIWNQMKQNAEAAALPRNGLGLLAGHLGELTREFPDLEVHLLGHSAGAILFGHLLDCLKQERLPVASVRLFAPACSVAFALQHYLPALTGSLIPPGRFHCEVMTDEREWKDSVGPYGHSLLYLVSRALEAWHKMPLLGMEGAWNPQLYRPAKQPTGTKPDLWHEESRDEVQQWHDAITALGLRLTPYADQQVSDGVEAIPLAHGSFDNDVIAIGTALQDIRGGALVQPVDNLHGF
jgi:hypothetical protein